MNSRRHAWHTLQVLMVQQLPREQQHEAQQVPASKRQPKERNSTQALQITKS
jgi:hypothetical protein